MFESLFGVEVAVSQEVSRVGAQAEIDQVEVAVSQEVSWVGAQAEIDQVAILVSESLDWPVEEASIIQQVDRFSLVEYTPIKNKDPQIILFENGGSFNQAVRKFQESREPATVRYWRQRVKRARLHVLAQLERLQPSDAERSFVNRWTANILARGVTAPHLFESGVL